MSKTGTNDRPRGHADHVVDLHFAAGPHAGAAGDAGVEIDRDGRIGDVEFGVRCVSANFDAKRSLPEIPIDAAHCQNVDWLSGPSSAGRILLVTVSGAVGAPGVYELEFGTPLGELIALAGGAEEPLRALLVGGYFGTWVGADRAMSLGLARADLRSVGAALGAGVVVALGESCSGLGESARVIDYLAAQSAGQCGPCVHGLRAIADSVGALAAGTASGGERERVLRWAADIRGRGACHHPDGAVRFVRSALREFGDELGADVEAGRLWA